MNASRGLGLLRRLHHGLHNIPQSQSFPRLHLRPRPLPRTKTAFSGNDPSTTHNVEQGLLVASLPPLKRILCLCPVSIPMSMSRPEVSAPSATHNNGLGIGHCGLDVPYEKDTRSSRKMTMEGFYVGMAVSDPYLAYATPIEPSNSGNNSSSSVNMNRNTTSTNTLDKYSERIVTCNHNLAPQPESSSSYQSRSHPSIVWEGLPQTTSKFLNQVGYHDIGAVVFGLPFKDTLDASSSFSDHDHGHGTTVDVDADMNMKIIRNSIQNHFSTHFFHDDDDDDNDEASAPMRRKEPKRMTRKHNLLNLQCLTDDSLTLNEALAMASEEPEMWEEIVLEEHDGLVCPNVQAAAALNAFLWKHTGGWKNTFG